MSLTSFEAKRRPASGRKCGSAHPLKDAGEVHSLAFAAGEVKMLGGGEGREKTPLKRILK